MEGYIQKQHQGRTKRFVQTLTLNSDEEARREYIKWHSPQGCSPDATSDEKWQMMERMFYLYE